jgi:RNA polymerase sigma-70 factor (ECF subfamily)
MGAAPRADDEIARARDGDRDALVAVLRRHNQRIFRIARAILRDDAEAEDAAQEAWVLAWRNLHQFEGRSSFGSWVGRIVAREAMARARRRRLVLLDGTEEETMDASVPDPERSAGRGEARALLEQAIDRLPEPFRAVFVLREIEELSVAETAELLDVPAETVKTRLHRARRRLRDDLEQTLESAGKDVFAFAGERCDRITAAVLERLGR